MGVDVKVSVIVPVFNAGETLQKCIESVSAQHYQNFELLLINDGSKDRSGDICDKYAKKDYRIKVFHKKNEGVSSTRNVGLKEARGEYIVFCDADDWMAADYVQGLMDELERYDVDLVDQGFERVYNDGSRLAESYDNTKCTQEDMTKWIEMLLTGHTGPFPKIYRAQIIQEHGLTFDTSLEFCEDLVFNLQYMKHATRGIYFSGKRRYYYRQVETSLGNSVYQKDMTVAGKALIKVMEVLNDSFYANLRIDREKMIRLRNKVIQLSMFFMTSLHNNSKRGDRIEALKTLKSYELDHYWKHIKTKNPLRKLFYGLFEQNHIRLAVCVEDLRRKFGKN